MPSPVSACPAHSSLMRVQWGGHPGPCFLPPSLGLSVLGLNDRAMPGGGSNSHPSSFVSDPRCPFRLPCCSPALPHTGSPSLLRTVLGGVSLVGVQSYHSAGASACSCPRPSGTV